MRYLQRASEKRDLTTFITLHQENIARKFGQRFIGLRDGEKVFDGYREELTIDAVDEIYGDIDTEEIFLRPDSSGEDGRTEATV